MIEKIALFRCEKPEGLCSIEALPELEVIEIFGNCDLTIPEMDSIREALDCAPEELRIFNRFVFLFPDQPSDLAFRLAEFLEGRVFKAAFVVHASIYDRFRNRMFWELCQIQHTEMAHLMALKLVAKYEVASIQDDLSVDYSPLSVDPDKTNMNKESDEAF